MRQKSHSNETKMLEGTFMQILKNLFRRQPERLHVLGRWGYHFETSLKYQKYYE